MRRPTNARGLGLPIVGGLVMALALPPTDILPAVFVGFAILAVVVRDAPSVRSAALRATAWATAGGIVGLRFAGQAADRFGDVGVLGGVAAVLALAAVQALVWGAGAAVTQVLLRRTVLPFAVAFPVGVLVACSLPGIFTWTPGGLMVLRPELVQLSEVVGERGVSVVLALVVALAVQGVGRPGPVGRRAVLVPLAVAVALLVGVDRWGAMRMDDVADRDRDRLTVALVDHRAPGVRGPDAMERLRRVLRLRALSGAAERAGAELVIWPETAYPVTVDRSARSLAGGSVAPVGPGASVPRLIGLRTRDEEGRRRNAATVLSPDGRVQPAFEKRRLLWFGETMPLRSLLRPLFPGAPDLRPGGDPRVLTAAGVRLGVLICYEEVDPETARTTVRGTRPQLLVGMTNASWFADTTAPRLQGRLAVLRAVESRTGLVRAVNGDGGSWADASGREREVRTVAPGVVLADVGLRSPDRAATLYIRFGEWPLRTLALLTALVGWGLARRRLALS